VNPTSNLYCRNCGHNYMSRSKGGRVIAYGCLIRRKEARRETLIYIQGADESAR
jgi:hypothetical protein